MSPRILAVTENDRDLWTAAVALFRGVDHDRHSEFIARPDTVAFLAVEDGHLVAWAWGYRQLRPDGDSMLLLYELEVVEHARRRGIGRSLVEAFLALAQTEGHRKMWLITGEDNGPAKALYKSTGGGRSDKDDVGYWWLLE